jgi:protein-L-isoaspartate(D-aspartate) O-methyltransferase
MVKEFIEEEGISDRRVLESMRTVPRHEFVPSNVKKKAYFDQALPIGYQQTISPPFIVAYMTQTIEPQPDDVVLEIGTGSGYQAAVLSRLLPRGHLYTVERVPVLAQRARELLAQLGLHNVTVELAGAALGAPQHAPYAGIIVTAASPQLADELVSQLAIGGRMVIPVGSLQQQELMQVRRTEEGLSVRWLGSCRFVPLIGKKAFPEQ